MYDDKLVTPQLNGMFPLQVLYEGREGLGVVSFTEHTDEVCTLAESYSPFIQSAVLPLLVCLVCMGIFCRGCTTYGGIPLQYVTMGCPIFQGLYDPPLRCFCNELTPLGTPCLGAWINLLQQCSPPQVVLGK